MKDYIFAEYKARIQLTSDQFCLSLCQLLTLTINLNQRISPESLEKTQWWSKREKISVSYHKILCTFLVPAFLPHYVSKDTIFYIWKIAYFTKIQVFMQN